MSSAVSLAGVAQITRALSSLTAASWACLACPRWGSAADPFSPAISFSTVHALLPALTQQVLGLSDSLGTIGACLGRGR